MYLVFIRLFIILKNRSKIYILYRKRENRLYALFNSVEIIYFRYTSSLTVMSSSAFNKAYIHRYTNVEYMAKSIVERRFPLSENTSKSPDLLSYAHTRVRTQYYLIKLVIVCVFTFNKTQLWLIIYTGERTQFGSFSRECFQKTVPVANSDYILLRETHIPLQWNPAESDDAIKNTNCTPLRYKRAELISRVIWTLAYN